ncbi:MAG: class I SAM-dependent methyltransferase, partial [Microcystaceae cyanobacterium]
MNNWKEPKDWYSIDLEERKKWYANIGDSYEKTRPGYEPELIKWIIATAALNPTSQLLEIGCGTGKATIPFSQLNCNLVGLEPNPDFYAIAQKNCS